MTHCLHAFIVDITPESKVLLKYHTYRYSPLFYPYQQPLIFVVMYFMLRIKQAPQHATKGRCKISTAVIPTGVPAARGGGICQSDGTKLCSAWEPAPTRRNPRR